jgi:hypothetical protein
MIWLYLLLAWLVLAAAWFALDAKKAPEVPPAEERPYIPVRVKVHLVTADRPLRHGYYAGMTIDEICKELSEGVTRG